MNLIQIKIKFINKHLHTFYINFIKRKDREKIHSSENFLH